MALRSFYHSARRNRSTEMRACSFNIIIFTMYLNFILYPTHGFEVIQPQNRTVNSDGVASISCEHTANVTSVEDVQLNSISLTGKPRRTLLCQKGMNDCKNIIMHEENSNKCLFIILNIGPEALNMKYECEFTVKKDDLDYTETGTPTILLPGEKEAVCAPPPQSHQLRWILTGVLALMFLYGCVITSFYIRLRFNNRDPKNSTYVVMRKAPLPRNPPFDIIVGS
ncbi:uncharacterized protein LOC121616071 isoform X3 [Chelmon rostratus]|uniref:uncharacterized protein LOC121616071 isoform X3 n=1 Tax=Chelmon rostratus TaxID=109905 RepID=UPI001BEB870A|nr:uncharacterized protein LOC121616071 isoform X3 [Chelmon rostratus]